jgi:magnesium transporter
MTEDQEIRLGKIRSALEHPDDTRLRPALAGLRAADIAEVFGLLSEEGRSRILYAVPSSVAAEIFVLLGDAVRGDVVEDLSTEKLADLASDMAPDDAADFLGDMTPQESLEVLDRLPAEQSEAIGQLLSYDEETAGGIMTTKLPKMSADQTVRDARGYLREYTDIAEEPDEVYIVDQGDRLVGSVAIRQLVINRGDTPLRTICDPDLLTVNVHDDQEAVVQMIRKYDVSSAPVVDAEGRLLGLITHDDLMDVAHEEHTEDLLRMGGTDPSELESSSLLRAARVRLQWLLPCLMGMFVSATVIATFSNNFSPELFATLVLFVPMIGAMGGNAGMQTTTVVVRGFATGELVGTRIWRAFFREGRIGFSMALVCGVGAWGLVTLGLPFLRSLEASASGEPGYSIWRLVLAVGCAMFTAIFVAVLLGVAMPFTFRKLGADPAIASGPFVTTITDITSVSIYLTLAMWIAS